MAKRVRLTKQASLTPEGLLGRVKSMGLSYRELALLVGRSHVHVYNVLQGKATSAVLLCDIDKALKAEKELRRGSK